MKRFFTLLLICFALHKVQISSAQTPTWQDMTPPGWSGNLKSIIVLNGGKLLAVSDKDYLYHSADTGNTWTVTKAPVTKMQDIKFYPDGKRGLALTYKELYSSSDAGFTWQKVTMTGIGDMSLSKIYIKSEDTLLAAASNLTVGTKILMSSDKGKTWKKVADNLYCAGSSAYTYLESFFFNTLNHGFAFGQGYYAITSDGGNTWTKTSMSTQDVLFGAVTNSKGEIVSVGNGSYAITDSNLSNSTSSGTFNGWEVGIGKYGKTICIADDYGDILTSKDDGYTWTSTDFSSNYKQFYGVVFLNDSVGFVCGNELTFYKTTNAGKTWTKIVYGEGEGATQIYCKSKNECYLTGCTGRLFHTIDGGNTWELKDIHTGALKNITFPTNDTGYISANGLIFRTIDGGNNWIKLKHYTSGDYLCFPSKDTGYVGYTNSDVAIQKTTDAGQTWDWTDDATYGQNASIGSAFFRTANLGLASGKNGILSTTNGGSSWNYKSLNFSSSGAASIIDLNGSDWIIMSGGGQIYKCDKDLNCTLKYTAPDQYKAFYQYTVKRDSLHIYTRTDVDSVLFTEDGGNTWKKNRDNLFGYVAFPIPNIAYNLMDYHVYKKIYKDSLSISSFQKNTTYSYNLIVKSNSSVINSTIYLVNDLGDTIYTVKKDIKNNSEFLITLPSTIPDGTYSMIIIPDDTFLYNIVKSQTFLISTTGSSIVESEKSIIIKVVDNTIICNYQKIEIYNCLGQRVVNSNLPSGIYYVKYNNTIQKIAITN
jgi:photosystem II stability/assembly factor-like uncharacterized protein